MDSKEHNDKKAPALKNASEPRPIPGLANVVSTDISAIQLSAEMQRRIQHLSSIYGD